jgi:endonuclease/exonuclease/phosphatase (EEP) superfamily protein YafD
VKLARVFAALHLALVVAALLSFALVGERSPRLTLLVYLPRVLFLIPSLAIAPWLWRGSRRWLWLQALTAALVAGPLMGLHLGQAREGKRALRVLSWQVWFGNGNRNLLARSIRELSPDLVLFEATGPDSNEVLQNAGFANYLEEDQFAAASRWPLKIVDEGDWVDEAFHRPWVRFEVQTPFGPLQAIAVHTRSPRRTLDLKRHGRRTLLSGTSDDMGMLDDHLAVLDAKLREAGPLAIAAGDFNASDGGAVLRGRFPGFDGVSDAFAETSFGYGYTFPINKRLFPWLRLDHLYAGKALIPLRSQVLAIPASDHAGLLVDLALR